MWLTLVKAFVFVKEHLIPILVSLGVGIALFFIVGFFVVRGELREAKRKLAEVEAQVEQLKKDVKDITAAHTDVARDAQQYRQKSDELQRRLERRGKKPIAELARKRAKLVEKAINSGTEKALRCLELVSNGGDC